MCVICYKPKGVEMPEKNVLEAMYLANPHGCGFCTPETSYKGLSFAQFYKKIRSVGEDMPCMMHFRLATTGSIKRSNCHPFYDKETNTFFMHNGVFNLYPMNDITDSEYAFRHIFMPRIKMFGLHSYELEAVVKAMRSYSKLAFMQGEDVALYGDFVHYDGLWVSNTRFTHYIR